MSDKPIPIITLSQAQFQARRAIDAAAIGPPQPPQHVALPGAKQAVRHDRLLAYQDADMGELEIVERVNGRWAEENAARLEAHARWVAGPYTSAIEAMRQADMEAQAEQLRRKAAFGRIIRGHEEG